MDYASIRGFNYLPSYAGNLQMQWTNFDRNVWEREVKWAKRFGTNMLRVWLDWNAWIALESELFNRFDEALGICNDNEIITMPVLFNRWNNDRLPMGFVSDRDLVASELGFGKFKPYVSGLMDRFGRDERIGIWDLCNEPQTPNLSDKVNFREAVWMSHVNDWVRRGSDFPVTIGTMNGDNIRVYAPLVDVISFHPYVASPGSTAWPQQPGPPARGRCGHAWLPQPSPSAGTGRWPVPPGLGCGHVAEG